MQRETAEEKVLLSFSVQASAWPNILITIVHGQQKNSVSTKCNVYHWLVWWSVFCLLFLGEIQGFIKCIWLLAGIYLVLIFWKPDPLVYYFETIFTTWYVIYLTISSYRLKHNIVTFCLPFICLFITRSCILIIEVLKYIKLDIYKYIYIYTAHNL